MTNKPFLVNKKNNIFKAPDRPIRDGIELEKGTSLTTDYLEEHLEDIENIMGIFVAYPDLYLDTIATEFSHSLFFYQRIFIRACMRFKELYVVACRAFSKSFISILAIFLQCVFIPGTRRFICAPNKKQGAQIAKEKLVEIFSRWPLLRREIFGGDREETPGNYGQDYVLLNFRNGSTFEVCGALESTRGLRKFGGLIDELRDHEEGPISEIVLPLLNVSRRLPDNTVNPKEPNQQTIFATSAGTKTSFAYDKLISCFENSIINPNSSFVFGCDYRVPMMHGLVDRKFINSLKMDPSFNEESFAREYKVDMYSLNY